MDGDDGGCYFPEDIVFEILTRVPAKDLIRFKVVCKPWCFLISDRKFVKAHLHCASRAQLEVLLVPNYNESRPCDYRSIKMHDLHFQTERLKSCPFEEDLDLGRAKLIDSCNGLLLFEKSLNKNKHFLDAGAPDALILYNPVTRQCKNIPGLTAQGWSSSSIFLTALVHDDFIDKYRIYSILSYPQQQHTAYDHFLGFIYKVGDENINEDWETFEFEAITKPDSDSFPPLSPLLFVKNELYWVALGDTNYDSDTSIQFEGESHHLSFYLFSLNVANQKFRMTKIIEIPSNFVYDSFILLSKVNGSLCMIISYRNNPNCLIDIWVLEDEINGLWSAPYKINIQSRFNNEPADFPSRFGYSVVVVSSKTDSHYSESEFEGWLDLDLNRIFNNRKDQLFLYDLKKETFKQIGSLGKEYHVYDSHMFHFDSLVTWIDIRKDVVPIL